MGGLAAEGERVPRLQQVGELAVAVLDGALDHVQELDPGVLEAREHLALVGYGDEERLEVLGRRPLVVGQQVVGVALLRSAADHLYPLAGLDVLGAADGHVVVAEHGGERHAQGPRHPRQGAEAGGGLAVLDLAEHPAADPGAGRDVGEGQALLEPVLAHEVSEVLVGG